MKLYIITSSSFPSGMADTKRLICYAKAVLEEGIDCEVLVYKRYSGFGEIQPKSNFEGINYRYVGGKSERGNNRFLSRFYDIVDRCSLYWFLKRNLKSGDVVLCYGSLYTSLIIDLVHSKKAKFVESLTEYPFLFDENSRFRAYYKSFVQGSLFPKFDGVLPISDELIRYSKQYIRKNCKICKIPILVEYENYELEDKSSSSNCKYIFHAGSLLESKDGILGMIEAFGKVCKTSLSDIKFISTGSIEKSPHSDEIKHLIDTYNLKDKITFTGFISTEMYQKYLQGASLVIINKYRTLQNQYCFSTKLSEYMAAGKAIIITNVGEAMNWLHSGEDAIIIEPEDSTLLARTIEKVLCSPEDYRHLGYNAQRTCKSSFDYRVYGKIMVDFFNTLYE